MARKQRKFNLADMALEATRFAGWPGDRAPGLARLFWLVEHTAFCAGVYMARESSYALDPDDLYSTYSDDPLAKQSQRKVARKPRRRATIADVQVFAETFEAAAHVEEATDPAQSTGEPPSGDAVDPSAEVLESGPRA